MRFSAREYSPPVVPSSMSAAPTALDIILDAYPALPDWADGWAAGPPGLDVFIRATFLPWHQGVENGVLTPQARTCQP